MTLRQALVVLLARRLAPVGGPGWTLPWVAAVMFVFTPGVMAAGVGVVWLVAVGRCLAWSLMSARHSEPVIDVLLDYLEPEQVAELIDGAAARARGVRWRYLDRRREAVWWLRAEIAHRSENPQRDCSTGHALGCVHRPVVTTQMRQQWPLLFSAPV